MKSICVYLGAKSGSSERFKDVVIQLGSQIGRSNIRLIYGGSSLGLMGLLATRVMDLGGQVTGIIPESLITQEKPLASLDELIITKTMQERKILMQQKADAFIVMPGGLGTLEEAFDTWNAIKIGVLNKPIGFLNIDGYFDDLFSFISHAEKHGFVSKAQAKIPKVNACPTFLISELLTCHLFEPA
ncbi:Rossman fold protein, TIGR00730 family [Legionella jamestowniensis]|uniref:Cytokinin riboside 5'-monophosphate phosphoribohydrolase n=1 Tax=Legionella jamestowniensis TaxID=455 RepID=A0ABX2XXV7_9GAMM|nr:TIGR00730 family Rossman fold protein [Legionella jamestowniensis]OCH99041.1 Rossman fold protein, TIGR00730 family [Legionella jamestowniensis]